MAMNERATAQIYLDGKQAEAALDGLKAKAKALKEAIIEAGKADDKASVKKLQSELKGVEGAMRNMKKETFDVQRVLNNLSGASINELQKAMQRVNAEMRRTSRTDPGYKKLQAQAMRLKGEINKVNSEMRVQQSFTAKLTDGFNKYFGVITAGAASFAGLIMAGRKAVDEFNKFDDQVADVMKTTGMTKDEVLELDKRLQKINTRTAQDELLGLGRVAGKLGITGVEDVEGFVRAADKINVALSEDLGGDAEQAINEIGKLTDIFKLKDEFGIEQSMLKVGSAINSLGAASTANEGYLVEFTKRMAGVAPAANVSIDQVLGLGATLDQFGQTSEISSTTIAAVLTDMFKSPGEYAAIAGMKIEDFNDLLAKDSNEAFIKFLEGLNGNNDGLGVMANKLEGLGLAGKRSVSVLGVLSNNTQTLREQQALSAAEFEKGTSLQEEFNIKNETAQARLEKARKAMGLYRRELGEKLQPIMAGVVSQGTLMLKFLSALIDLFDKYRTQIIIITGAIATYTAAVKIKSEWDKISTGLTIAKNTAEKAYSITTGILTGKIKIATVVQKLWNKTVMANPILAVVAAVAALAAGTVWLVKKLKEQTAAQKVVNDVNKQAQKAVIDQKIKVNELLSIARDETRSLEDRKKALEELNKISPKYFGNLSLEKINSEEAKKATDDYINSLVEKARVQAAQEKLVELERKRLEDEIDGNDKKVKWHQKLGNAIISNGNMAVYAARNASSANKNASKAQKEYNEQVTALQEILKKGNEQTEESPDEKNKRLQQEEADRKAKELEENKKNNEQKIIDNENAAKQALDLAKKTHEKELLELRQSMMLKGATQDEMNAVMQHMEIEHLGKLLAIQKKYGQDTTSIESSIIDKQLKLREDYQKNIEGIEKAIAEAAKNLNLDDETFDSNDEDYQKGVEALNRFEELRKKYQSQEKTDRELLNAELTELNEAFNYGGILTHEEFERKKLEITAKYAGERLSEENKYLQGAHKVLDTLSSSFEAAKQREIQAAGDNADKKEAIERRFAQKQQKIAIGQALINGALAQVKILAETPKADFGIMTAILMTAAAAATAAEVATIANQQFYTGGYTGPGGKYEPKGIVHAKEFVTNSDGTSNPAVRHFTDVFDYYQRTGQISRITMNDIIATLPKKQMWTGGYSTTLPQTNNNSSTIIQTQTDPMLIAFLQHNASLLQTLEQNGVRSEVNALEIEKKLNDRRNAIEASNG